MNTASLPCPCSASFAGHRAQILLLMEVCKHLNVMLYLPQCDTPQRCIYLLYLPTPLVTHSAAAITHCVTLMHPWQRYFCQTASCILEAVSGYADVLSET